MRSRVMLAVALLSCSAAIAPAAAQEQDSAMQRAAALHWIRSPQTYSVATVAHVALPAGTKALNSVETDQFLQIMGNLPTFGEYAISAEDYEWFSVFSFDPSGYVKDDERIDPDQLLQALKSNNAKAVEEKKSKGLEPLYIDGWYIEPHYDVQSHRLEWATKLHGEKGETVINYSSRLLGRTGVMSAVLVPDPANFTKDLATFHALLDRFNFDQGQKYAEFRQGDKVAAYGLGALVVGGAAAAAVKVGGGALKGIAYAIFAAFAGAVAWIKSLFSRRKKN